MGIRRTPMRQVYVRDEARAIIERLCDIECRSLTDQVTVIVREYAKGRGLDPDEIIAAAAGAKPAKAKR